MTVVENLEAMLARGQDSALLRYSLGNEYAKTGRLEDAIAQLRLAVAHDPNYSAAWKLLGNTLADRGRVDEAGKAYQEGIRVAQAKGDVQAAKEMAVFQKRLPR